MEVDFYPAPPVPKFHQASDEERKRYRHVPWHNGHRPEVMIDIEECYIEREDRYSDALVRVKCPHCKRTNAPLMSSKTAFVEMDWIWVGISHQEPRSGYLCICPGCKMDYILTICVPQ